MPAWGSLEIASHSPRELIHRAQERSLQIDVALVGDDDDRPEDVGQFVLQAHLHVIRPPAPFASLHELRQISDVANEPEREVLERPRASVRISFGCLLEPPNLTRAFDEGFELHRLDEASERGRDAVDLVLGH
jgi:hypothetical protein